MNPAGKRRTPPEVAREFLRLVFNESCSIRMAAEYCGIAKDTARKIYWAERGRLAITCR